MERATGSRGEIRRRKVGCRLVVMIKFCGDSRDALKHKVWKIKQFEPKNQFLVFKNTLKPSRGQDHFLK